MKKLISLLLLGIAILLPIQAQEVADHDIRMYLTVVECDDLTQVPIELHLENPTIGITAIEMYLTLPEGATISDCVLNTRSIGTHEVTDGDTPRGYFVSVASEDVKNLSSTEGAVCTILCDFSTLTDGDFFITASVLFAVGVADNVVTCYITTDQELQYTKNGDVVTGVDDVKVETGVLEIYNLQGMRLAEPQKGQINIVNGKKQVKRW